MKAWIQRSTRYFVVFTGMALLTAVFLVSCASTAGTERDSSRMFRTTRVQRSEDGGAYVITHQGQSRCLPEKQQDISAAYMTPDDSHVAVLLNNGQLYITDGEINGRETLCSDAAEVLFVRNEGLVYRDGQGKTYRFLFGEKISLPLETSDDRLACAEHCLTLLMLHGDQVCSLRPEDTKPIDMEDAPKDHHWRPLCVSDDGQTGIWENTEQMQVHVSKIGCFSHQAPLQNTDYVYATFSADQKIVSISEIGSECFRIVDPEAGLVSYHLGAGLASPPNTSQTYLFDSTYEKGEDIYVKTYSDPGPYDVIHIACDGTKTEMLSDVTSGCVFGGRIFYTLAGSKLYTAVLSGSEMQEDAEIGVLSSDWRYLPTYDGKYVYYLTDSGNDLILNCYDTEEKRSQVVAENVTEEMDLDSCGQGILFYQDDKYELLREEKTETSLKGYAIVSGTLMLWRPGDAAPAKIDAQVVCNSNENYTIPLQSGLPGFYYERAIRSAGDGHYTADLCFYDGQTSQVIIPGVIH